MYVNYTDIKIHYCGMRWEDAQELSKVVSRHIEFITKEGYEIIDISTQSTPENEYTAHRILTTITYGKRKPNALEGVLDGRPS